MSYPQILHPFRQRVESALQELFESCHGPAKLIEAMGYSLFAGGKRIRPVLTVITSELFEHSLDPMPAACAFEFIHTYSLIHDDLPSMDDDDLRRGKATSHKKFGEALAILAGDALLTEAFGLVARAYGKTNPEIGLKISSEMALAAGSGGMVGGQVLDMDGAGATPDKQGVEKIHRMKTGALIRASVRTGALLAEANEADIQALTSYGESLGLAFQVADDILDVIGSDSQLGKTAGKDMSQGKQTYPSFMGLEQAKDYARSLVHKAKEAIEGFGNAARPLEELATFIQSSIEN